MLTLDAPPTASVTVRRPGDGAVLQVLDEVATFKLSAADDGSPVSLVELDVPPGGGVPTHAHGAAAHVLYVLDGTFAFSSGDTRDTLGAGACVHVPRGAPHAYRNVGPERGHLLLIATPPTSADDLFLGLAASAAARAAGSPELASAVQLLAARRGVTLTA